MEVIRQAIDRTVEKCLSEMNLDLFSKHYGPIFETHPQDMTTICEQAKDTLRGHMHNEIDQIFREENLQDLLGQLKELRLKQADKQGTLAWRPSGIPQVDLADHYSQIKHDHVSSLRKDLLELESQNKILESSLLDEKEKTHELRARIEEKSKKFDDIMSEIKRLPFNSIVVRSSNVEMGLYEEKIL